MVSSAVAIWFYFLYVQNLLTNLMFSYDQYTLNEEKYRS